MLLLIVNKELIMKLIERARTAAENSYCPYTNMPVGCALLVDDNMIFGGCNIENKSLGASVSAGATAIFKSISEGCTKFRAICLWSQNLMPYPDGAVRQILSEFCPNIQMIVATDETYSMLTLDAIFPFPPEAADAE
jgi:cytidine deaminase